MLEAAIEKQISKLDSKCGKKPETQSSIGPKKASEIDLDTIRNEFREVDFHPLEANPPDRFTYSANFENL